MDKLSNLIQEAKPLYFKKKRQKRILNTFIVLFIPFMMCLGAIGIYNTGNDIYISMENETFQQELLNDNMGLLR